MAFIFSSLAPRLKTIEGMHESTNHQRPKAYLKGRRGNEAAPGSHDDCSVGKVPRSGRSCMDSEADLQRKGESMSDEIADWQNRRTDSLDGWINELATLAEHPKSMPNFLRSAMKTIVHGLRAHAGPDQCAVQGEWQMVPREPTEAMLAAAAHESMQHLLDCINNPEKARHVGSEENIRKTHACRYRAMLNAAPRQPTYRP